MFTGVGGGAAAVVAVPSLVARARRTDCVEFPLGVGSNGGAVGGVASEGAI